MADETPQQETTTTTAPTSTTEPATTTTTTPESTTTAPTSTTQPATTTTTQPEETTTTRPQVAPQTVQFSGISVAVPSGWEVRIRQAQLVDDGAVAMPVMHASTAPLPAERADFGGGAVELLGPQDVFLSLVEYGEEAVGTALFPERDTFPDTLEASKFHPMQLQRIIPGQAGQQVFFSYQGRAFCLYAVIGSAALAGPLTLRANELLSTLAVDVSPTS